MVSWTDTVGPQAVGAGHDAIDAQTSADMSYDSDPTLIERLQDGFDDWQSAVHQNFQNEFDKADLLITDSPFSLPGAIAAKAINKLGEGVVNIGFGVLNKAVHPLNSIASVAEFVQDPVGMAQTYFAQTPSVDQFRDLLSAGLGASVTIGSARPWLNKLSRDKLDVSGEDASLPGVEPTPGAVSGKRLDRDFSQDMVVKNRGVLTYPGPELSGATDHGIRGYVLDGALGYVVKSSPTPGIAQQFGHGNEMFASMMRAFEKHGVNIDSIAGHWDTSPAFATNLDQFNELARQGNPASSAAAGTFAGKQAASFGYTRVEVLSTPDVWEGGAVDVRFCKPDWGPDPQWANYANVYARAMGRR